MSPPEGDIFFFPSVYVRPSVRLSVHVGATLGVHLSVERLVMGTSNVSDTTLRVEVHIDHFVKM